MKFDFVYHNPTKIYFGKEALSYLGRELCAYGNKILLAYGSSSLKRYGLYDKITDILREAGKEVFELSGIPANPTYEKVLEGAEIVRKNQIDFILAVGGGSVIDCAKAISAASFCKEDFWDKYYLRQEEVDTQVLPIASVLTMAGTGSEMNGGSVITHYGQKLKVGRVFSTDLYPKFSILNPEFTFTVPEYQMKSGIFDIMSHLMEQYFSGEDENVSDYLIEGLLRSVIESTKRACANPQDYEARSNIMWASTVALNRIVGVSKEQDWEVHAIEHQLGAYTNCAHGMGLAAISVPYYRYIYKQGLEKFVRFAKNVWNISEEGKTKEELALAGIDALEAFIKENGMVSSLAELGATKEMLPLIAESSYSGGGYGKVSAEDILKILVAGL